MNAVKFALLSPSVLRIIKFNKCGQMHLHPFSPVPTGGVQQIFRLSSTLKSPLIVIIEPAFMESLLTFLIFKSLQQTYWGTDCCHPCFTPGYLRTQRLGNLFKATQLCKKQSQASIPVLLHAKKVLTFRQIMPTSLVLEIHCLKPRLH